MESPERGDILLRFVEPVVRIKLRLIAVSLLLFLMVTAHAARADDCPSIDAIQFTPFHDEFGEDEAYDRLRADPKCEYVLWAALPSNELAHNFDGCCTPPGIITKGDVATFVLSSIYGISLEKVLPDSEQQSWKEQGVWAYYTYVEHHRADAVARVKTLAKLRNATYASRYEQAQRARRQQKVTILSRRVLPSLVDRTEPVWIELRVEHDDIELGTARDGNQTILYLQLASKDQLPPDAGDVCTVIYGIGMADGRINTHVENARIVTDIECSIAETIWRKSMGTRRD